MGKEQRKRKRGGKRRTTSTRASDIAFLMQSNAERQFQRRQVPKAVLDETRLKIYPPRDQRRQIVAELKHRDPSTLIGEEWWQLGEFQIVEGLETNNESMMDEGATALLRGIQEFDSIKCKDALGWLHCYRRQDAVALFYIDQVVAAWPDSHDAWSLHGWANVGVGDAEAAIASLNRAGELASDPGGQQLVQWIQSGKPMQSIRNRLVLCKFGNSKLGVGGPYGDGQADIKNRILSMQQNLRRDPEDPASACALAGLYYEQSNTEAAKQTLEMAIHRNPDHVGARITLMIMRERLGEIEPGDDESAACVRHILEMEPDNFSAGVRMVAYHMHNEEHRHALELIERLRPVAERSQDEDGTDYANLLHMEAHYMRDRFENDARALKLWQRSIRAAPSGIGYSEMIATLLRLDRPGEARRAFSEARRGGLKLGNGKGLSRALQYAKRTNAEPLLMLEQAQYVAEVAGTRAGQHLLRRVWMARGKVPGSARERFASGVIMTSTHMLMPDMAAQAYESGWLGPNPATLMKAYYANALAIQGEWPKAGELIDKTEPDDLLSSTLLNMAAIQSMDRSRMAKTARATLKYVHEDLCANGDGPDNMEHTVLMLATMAPYLTPGDTDPFAQFMAEIEEEYGQSLQGKSILALIAYYRGDIVNAARAFIQLLWDGDNIRAPYDIHPPTFDNERIAVLSEDDFRLKTHRVAALCLRQARRTEHLEALIAFMRNWRGGEDGFWPALEVELALESGSTQAARAIEHKEPQQWCWKLAQARIAMHDGDLEKADALLPQIIEAAQETCSSIHPLGVTLSVAQALTAEREMINNRLEQARAQAQRAVKTDPSSVFAWQTIDKCLAAQGDSRLRREWLARGLEQFPGHPQLVGALVESLVDVGDVGAARTALARYRKDLAMRGEQLVGYRLGEWIAVDQLSRLQDAGNEWAWADGQAEPLRSWLQAAQITLGRGDELAAAYGLYAGKIGEHILLTRVMEPFRDAVGSSRKWCSEQYQDVARFLAGGCAPSIGVITRLFESAAHSMHPGEDALVTRFRQCVHRDMFGDRRILGSARFLRELRELGQMRNSVAHRGAHGLEETLWATRCVIHDGQPGLLFTVLDEPPEDFVEAGASVGS